MKKTIVMILVALVAMVGIFAAGNDNVGYGDFSSNSVTSSESVTLEVKVEVPATSFMGHYYGFTMDTNKPSDPVLSVVPKAASTLKLKFNTEDNTIESTAPVYAYWKIRSEYNTTVWVGCSGLKKDTDPTKIITLKVTTDSTPVNCSEPTPTTKIYSADFTGGASTDTFGNQAISFATDAVTGTEVGNFTATLSMYIKTRS